jgi:hypothetical protein
MLNRKRDPGPCPVDDAPHTTCTSPDYGSFAIPQLPSRDGVARDPIIGAVQVPAAIAEFHRTRLRAEVIQETLPPGQVTTATYRVKRRKR